MVNIRMMGNGKVETLWVFPKIGVKPPKWMVNYPLVNDHIAGWNDITIFDRKYIFNPSPFSSQLC